MILWPNAPTSNKTSAKACKCNVSNVEIFTRYQYSAILIAGSNTVQVEPDFDGAPAQWLDTFDKYTTIPERYDIPDGLGIIQVLVVPQVRSVLQELRRWPGRYVSGQRAEAFIRNPYAALGEDAVAVIDETQFEQARAAAGIEFEQFFIDVDTDDNGKINSVALLIESTSVHNQRSSRFQLADAKQLEDFIGRFGYQLNAGQFKVKPFVVSLSNHERLNIPPFDKLRANG